MTQTEPSTQPVDRWAVTARQLARDCAALASPATAGTEDAPRAVVRGMRSMVNDVLDLERLCIDDWRMRLPSGEAAWALSRANLALAAAALEARAALWQAWFTRAESASRAVAGTPAGESEWPPASPERGAVGTSGSATAAD